MKISFSNHFYTGLELTDERLNVISYLGYEDIEFWTMMPHIDLDDDKSVRTAFQLLRDAGLRINSYHAPIFKPYREVSRRKLAYITDTDDAVRRETLRFICRSIEIMSESGSKIVVVHGDIKDKNDLTGSVSALKKSLKEICETASRKDTFVALENTERELPVRELAGIVEDLNLDNLGICVDAGHANIFEDAVEAIKTAGEHLVNIHVSDNDGKGDSHLHPGRGNIRWNEIGVILNKMNYKGSATLEVKSSNGIDGITYDEVKKLFQATLFPSP